MTPVTLLSDKEIKIGVPLSGYRLIPGYRGRIALPVELYLYLYAVKNTGEMFLIMNPEDLSPFISHIDNEDQAWQVLRLFTDPTTHYLFQKEVYTIDVEVSMNGNMVGFGKITSEVAQHIGYCPPEIGVEDHKYISRRDLVRARAQYSSERAKIIRRREAISNDGTYYLIGEKMIGEVERGEVTLPSYE